MNSFWLLLQHFRGTTAGGGRNCREYGYAHKFNSGATLGFGVAAVCLKIYFSNSGVCDDQQYAE